MAALLGAAAGKLDAGDLDAARAALARDAGRGRPLPPEALGLVTGLPRTDAAAGLLEALSEALHDDPVLALGLGLRDVEAGEAARALPRLRLAAASPALAPALAATAAAALAGALLGLGRAAECLAAARRWSALAPGDAVAQIHAAAAALALRDAVAARPPLLRAIRLAPALVPPDMPRLLAEQLTQMDRHAEVVEIAEAGAPIAPWDLELRFLRAVSLARCRSVAESHAELRRLVARHPAHARALNALGVQLAARGRAGAGAAWMRRALAADPADHRIHSNLLLTLQYLPEMGAAEMLEEHREWDRRHGAAAARRAAPAPRPAPGLPPRRLRIGYVSPDFRIHPVGYFMVGVVAAHDRAGFEVACYMTSPAEDGLTRAFRERAERWVPCWRDGDDELAARVRADGIDVLVDLAGHTDGNRLGVFARRPAPVQASWAGYVGTTGLSAIDYLISDHVHSPPWADRWAVERIARLPNGYVCYAPPVKAPPVGPPPALATGRVTFGCFNNAAKLNAGVAAAWSRLLRGRPDRRLRLQSAGLERPEAQAPLLAAFAAGGVDPEQVEFRGFVPPDELVASYAGIDLALDPFPYSGGLTTLEALWMGVPVVTRPGERFCSRHSASHLANVGLGGFVAASEEEYVAIAEAWASDLGRLAGLRAGLRDRMLASPLCDWAGFTADLEALYRRLWLDKAGEG
jgi:predicted O-linked N-acetylglucosamine transferase (SPINDLY family)